MAFNIGDRVQIIPNNEFFFTQGGETGTIHSKTRDNKYYITWDTQSYIKFKNQDEFCRPDQWYIPEQYIKLLKENGLNPIETRIKNLWNNSNWVKNNPQQAY